MKKFGEIKIFLNVFLKDVYIINMVRFLCIVFQMEIVLLNEEGFFLFDSIVGNNLKSLNVCFELYCLKKKNVLF